MARRGPPKPGTRHHLAAEPIDVHDPAVLRIDLVSDGDEVGGWVHTHGLEAFGLPELEIRGVRQRYLMPLAGHILTEIADYLLNGTAEVRVGDSMDLGFGTQVRFERSEPLPDQPGHFDDERWCVVDAPEHCCALCSALEQAGGRRPPASPGELAN